MRVIFNEELKQVADDLDRMAQNVRKAIKGAGEALLNQDVEAAQTVIDGDIEIDALESSVIDQCVKLLAKQNPVATDLRVVVSTMRLASTFERMGDLARHVAEAARRTYPAAAIPESAQPVFAEMIDFLDNTADQLVAMLFDRDASRPWISCCWAASWSVSAITPCPPPAVWCTSSPASTPLRSRPATRAPTSTDWDLFSHWANN